MPIATINSDVYTRGKPGEDDARGESMVEKHKARMQAAKENAATEKLASLLPAFGSMVRSMALTENNWDVDQAHLMLKAFERDKLEELEELRKNRKKVVKDLEEKKSKRSGSDASDASVSGSDSEKSDPESDSGSDERKRDSKRRSKSKRSRKDDSRKKSKSKRSKKESSRKRRSKDKDRDSKKRKRSKREASPSSDSDAAPEFGKYGVLREADLMRKFTEFAAWAQEVKGLDLEAMPKFEEKELFKEYAEDYNLGVLPHKKYYDVELWKKSQALKGERTEPAAPANITDEELKRREMLAAKEREKESRLNAMYEELKRSGQASEMKQQELLRSQMALAYKTGNIKEAQRIRQRLEPDTEQDRRDAAKRGYKPAAKKLPPPTN